MMPEVAGLQGQTISGHGRRRLVAGAGAVIVLAVASTAWRAADQGVIAFDDHAAYAPWDDWQDGRRSGPLALVAAAILASSPHDTQPWLFRVDADRIDVFLDRSRHLGPLDPYRREATIGLGCALENMLAAAPGEGLDATAALLPSADDPTHVARLMLARRVAAAPAGRLSVIGLRHTDRGAYQAGRPVPADVQAGLEQLADASEARLMTFDAATTRGRAFAGMTDAATQAIVADPGMMTADGLWYRATPRETLAHRDGVTPASAGLSPLVSRLVALAPAPSNSQQGSVWVRVTRDRHLATAASFGLILVEEPYDARGQLLAGRLWQRIHLEGTRLGLAMQPLNQIPEMIDRERDLGRAAETASRLAAIVGEPGRQAIFAFRMGWPTNPAPGGRWRPSC